MNIRGPLLIFSILIIGSCLTLFFQSDHSIQSMNFEQYQNLSYNESRSHSLEEFNQKIAPYRLEEVIGEIYEKNRLAGEKTRIMELGFDNGRILMELKKLFPDIEFYGINKEKTHTFYRRESFIMTALKFKIMTKTEAENTHLPYVVFQDLDFGTPIPYSENKFDLIYSEGTLSQIRYSFELFNEILRVLKKNALSIHSDLSGVNIYGHGVLVSIKEAAKEFRKKGIEFYVLDNPKSIRFKSPEKMTTFPVTPHHPIPQQRDHLSREMRRPEMSYNLTF